MKSKPYSGAYSRRFSNYSPSAKASSGTGSYNLIVTSADPSLGEAVYKQLVSVSQFSSALQAEPAVSNRGSHDSGTHFRAVAKPKPGCHFVQWQTNIDGVGNTTQNPIEFALSKDTSLVACFAKDLAGDPENKVANVSWDSKMGRVNGNGLVLSAESRSGSGQLTATQGSTVSLTASPLAGYKFVAWRGAPVEGSTSTTVSFQMNGNYAIRAEFATDTPVGPNTPVDPETPGDTPIGPETPGNVGGASTGFNLKSFVKKWWWAILIVAYIVCRDRKGGLK